MKTTFTKLFAGAAFLIGTLNTSAQDLVPGFNYSYNPPGSDGIITGITIDVCNNESDAASSFYVGMYLYDQSSSNYWVIGETNITSLSGNSCITISNWDIDINNANNIPAGTYRLGIWADSQEEITETDESNNAGLLSGNINYTPSAVGLKSSNAAQLFCEAAPNPAVDFATVSFTTRESGKVSITVFNELGQQVFIAAEENITAGKHSYTIDLSSLESGMYFYSVRLNNSVVTRKLIKQ